MFRNLICAVSAALLFSACGGGGGSSSAAPAPGLQTLVVPSVSDVRLDNVNSQGIAPNVLINTNGVALVDTPGDAPSSSKDIIAARFLRDNNNLYVAMQLAGAPVASSAIEYNIGLIASNGVKRYGYNGASGVSRLSSDFIASTGAITATITDGLSQDLSNGVIYEIPLAELRQTTGKVGKLTMYSYVIDNTVVVDSTAQVILDFQNYEPNDSADRGGFSTLPVYVKPFVSVISLGQAVTVEWSVRNPPVTTITETDIRWDTSMTTSYANSTIIKGTSSPTTDTLFSDSFTPTSRGVWVFTVFVTDGVKEASSVQKEVTVQ